MVPTSPLLSAMAAALAADTTTLAEVLKVQVYLIKAAFVPALTLQVSDLTLANFTGSSPLAVATATAQVFQDPATGEWIIQLDEPAGGWHWVTGDTVNLPQTIYGYALTNHAGSSLWGTALLPGGPVLLNSAGQGIDVAQVRFRVSNGSLS